MTLSCSGGADKVSGPSVPGPVTAIDVELSPPSIVVKQTSQATAKLRDASNNSLTGRLTTWSSSDTAVASVSSSGMVTGNSPGAVTIRASSEGVIGAANLTVSLAPVAVVSVTITPAAGIVAGSIGQATAVLSDARGNQLTGRTVTWASSDSTIASVSGQGAVTGKKPGTASIVATSENVTGTASIRIIAVPSERISVSLSSTSIVMNTTAQATAVVTDESGAIITGRPISWASSDTLIARINSNGLITGKGAGTVSLIATSGSTSGTAVLTVTFPRIVYMFGLGQDHFDLIRTVGSLVDSVPRVLVVDMENRPVPGIQVRFEVTAGGGGIAGTDLVTDAQGTARTNGWTMGTVSNTVQKLVATARFPEGTEVRGAGNPVTFSYTTRAGHTAQLIRFSGDGRQGVAGQSILRKPAVRVLDQFGNAPYGDTLKWSISGGSGRLSGPTVMPIQHGANPDYSDISGSLFSVDDWFLGEGSNSLTATVGSLSVSFSAIGGAPSQSPFEVETVLAFSSASAPELAK